MTDEKEYQVKEVPDPKAKSFGQMMLYKMDRTLAIAGIVILGGISIFGESGNNPVTIGAVGALGAYLGVKGAK